MFGATGGVEIGGRPRIGAGRLLVTARGNRKLRDQLRNCFQFARSRLRRSFIKRGQRLVSLFDLGREPIALFAVFGVRGFKQGEKRVGAPDVLSKLGETGLVARALKRKAATLFEPILNIRPLFVQGPRARQALHQIARLLQIGAQLPKLLREFRMRLLLFVKILLRG